MTKKNSTGHSPVGASGRHRWKNCAGSVNLCKTLPPAASSAYADEGTLAHEHAAYYLENNQTWREDITDDMRENLEVYVNEVLETIAVLNRENKENLVKIEHGFTLEMLHPDAYGTADAVIYDADTQTLYVYDLKYGAGILVEAEDNDQLIYYAVGAFLSLDLPAQKVVLKIIQPRCPDAAGDYIRPHTFTSDKLLDAANEITAEIQATDDPNAKLNAGEWCRFCPAAGVCKEIHSKAMVAWKSALPSVTNIVENGSYDPVELAKTLDKLPILEAFVSQVREFAYGEAMKGRTPPDYKLVQKRPTRKWKPQPGINKFLSKVIMDSEKLKSCWTAPELRSPAQIEKIVPKTAKKSLGEFIFAESSGYKLVHNSEPGEPVVIDPAKIFTEIEDEDNGESLLNGG